MSELPKHIGFIMDGNGRWAKLRGMPRVKGHRAGLKTVDTVIALALKHKIECVSLFVFSTENWSRPQSEIDALFGLARDYLKKTKNFSERNIKVVVSGTLDKLPADLVNSILKTEKETAACSGMTLNLCINYGGRDEIVFAVNRIIGAGLGYADEKTLRQYMFNPGLPDLDLVVRTSGELRVSNFMLFQSAYAELYFTDVLWPDFDENEFLLMLKSFEKRTRRFGDVQENN